MTRFEVINHFIRARGFRSFLEIGTAMGETFRAVDCTVKASVDPDMSTDATYHMTSDEYFAQYRDKFDIIFIDGLHECHQAMRDILNALEHLNPGGVIVMHDCHPKHYLMQLWKQFDTMPWTGNVWKAFVSARAVLPYEMYVYDDDWGCGIIDTARQNTEDTSGLPTDMDRMNFRDFETHPEWMDFRKELDHGEC